MNKLRPLNDCLKLNININLSVKEMDSIYDALEDECNLLIMNRFITNSTKRRILRTYRNVQNKIRISLKKAGVPGIFK